jgi:hypothetical protein
MTMIDATVLIYTTGRRLDALHHALDSVSSQRVGPRETLIVVDGTPDVAETVRASLSAFSSLAPKVLCTGEQRGASVARNVGANSANGAFLCFLDEHDCWKPDYLARAFEGDSDFDLVITGFEKHTECGTHVEKVDLSTLHSKWFIAKKPCIRSSNIVVRARVFLTIGGFDEQLVLLNDVDFVLRLFALEGLRSRAVHEPLVESYGDGGEQQSKRGSVSVLRELQSVFARYESKMSPAICTQFRAWATRNLGLDPWSPVLVLERGLRASDDAMGAPMLRFLDERVLEALDQGDRAVDQALSDVWCFSALSTGRRESFVQRLRLAVISTDDPHAVASLLASLRDALEHSGWYPSASSGDRIEVLVLENDPRPRSADARRQVIDAAGEHVMKVHFVPVASENGTLSTARARAKLFRSIRERGWIPSPTEPLWILDDDFRFEQLLPSRELGFRVVQNPSLLHRMALLVSEHRDVDALVCGNSGAAPVPALGLFRLQLRDLLEPPNEQPWCDESMRDAVLSGGNYYGYSCQDPEAERRRAWRCAWWLTDRQWCWDDVTARLLGGLPVTRPALAAESRSALRSVSYWGTFDAPRVAGGNTILLSPRALEPEWLRVVRCRELESRRADAVWCNRAQKEGLRFVQVSIPLLHQRVPRAQVTAADLVRDAASDALGVGLYRASSQGRFDDLEAIRAIARERLSVTVRDVDACVEMLASTEHPLSSALLSKLREVKALLREVRFDVIER